MLLYTAVVLSFCIAVPFCVKYTVIDLSNLWLINFWVVSNFGLLRMLLWTFLCISFGAHECAFLMDILHGMELLGHG